MDADEIQNLKIVMNQFLKLILGCGGVVVAVVLAIAYGIVKVVS